MGKPTTAEIRAYFDTCEIADKDKTLFGIILNRLEAFDNIYQATNLMLSELGAAGEITTRHETVSDLMDALHDYDNGVYDCKLLNKLHKAEQTIRDIGVLLNDPDAKVFVRIAGLQALLDKHNDR